MPDEPPMSITSLTTPDRTIAQSDRPGQATGGRHSERMGHRPAPGPEKMRGLRLIAVWVGLTAGSWAVLGGAGYGLYTLVGSLLP
ncbi:hypothetical protein FZ942_08610 [Azospirillum lipoferum]|uniref:Uncharacterized protein n=2 Tax=Azospirillaceae TaxID=2829815 RepID=A0A5A9GTK7_AZOLI|nr:hypothetical protein FZ942_08610 [Azospirillum lipoferum]